MCGAGNADRGLLREERVCRMIVMAAQSRLLNPLERLQSPEPAPAGVCVSQSGWAPGHRAGEQAGSVLRESPAPRRRCPVTVAPAGRAGAVPVSRGLWSRRGEHTAVRALCCHGERATEGAEPGAWHSPDAPKFSAVFLA